MRERGLKLVHGKMIRCHEELLGRVCFRWLPHWRCDTDKEVSHTFVSLLWIICASVSGPVLSLTYPRLAQPFRSRYFGADSYWPTIKKRKSKQWVIAAHRIR